MKKLVFFLLLYLLTVGLHAFAQKGNTDSLLNLLKNVKADSVRVNIYNSLASELRRSDPDTAMFYSNEALRLSNKIGFQKGIANSLNNIGSIHKQKSNYRMALEVFSKSLAIRQNIKDSIGISGSYNNMGTIYELQGNYPLALQYQIKALEIQERNNDVRGKVFSYLNIGSLHDAMGNSDKALESYNKGLQIQLKRNDRKGVAFSYNFIGLIYFNRKEYQKALNYHLLSLKLKKEINDIRGMSASYNNIGNIYSEQNEFSLALEQFYKALVIDRELNNKNGMAIRYINIGSIYQKQNNYRKAADSYEDALEIGKEIGNKETIKAASVALAEVFEKTGRYREALKYFRIFTEIKDSLLNEESTRQISDIEAKYNTEKKEKEIKLLNKDKLLQQTELDKNQAELKQQKTQRNAFVLGFALVGLAGVFIFRSYKQKQKANVLLSLQNNEIKYQKNIIQEKNKDIIDSIHYANRIQTALLKEEEHITEHLPPHFILFRPKDILSGDFYWTLEKQNHLYVAAADCTGHGVPGAMMSMLGIAFLNEITGTEKLQTPAEILDQLRDKIIKDLKSKDGITKDGMDISLIRLKLNVQSLKLEEVQWAGANNPLWIVSSKSKVESLKLQEEIEVRKDVKQTLNIEHANFELQEVRPDKQPIGFSHDLKPFTNHEISLSKGDTIYLFTDGYADQFGGEKGKKFKYAKLKELLVNINDKPVQDQKEILNETFENWKGNLEQVDDVCIIGVRV